MFKTFVTSKYGTCRNKEKDLRSSVILLQFQLFCCHRPDLEEYLLCCHHDDLEEYCKTNIWFKWAIFRYSLLCTHSLLLFISSWSLNICKHYASTDKKVKYFVFHHHKLAVDESFPQVLVQPTSLLRVTR